AEHICFALDLTASLCDGVRRVLCECGPARQAVVGVEIVQDAVAQNENLQVAERHRRTAARSLVDHPKGGIASRSNYPGWVNGGLLDCGCAFLPDRPFGNTPIYPGIDCPRVSGRGHAQPHLNICIPQCLTHRRKIRGPKNRGPLSYHHVLRADREAVSTSQN